MTDPDTGVVRLAFLDSIATSLVPRVLRDFHQHAPRVRVLLSQEPAHDIVDDLGSAAVDLAITSACPPGAYGWHPLQGERLVLVVPAGHRLRGRKRVELSELADEELVTTPVGFGYRTLVDGLLRDAGVSPAVSFESQDSPPSRDSSRPDSAWRSSPSPSPGCPAPPASPSPPMQPIAPSASPGAPTVRCRLRPLVSVTSSPRRVTKVVSVTELPVLEPEDQRVLGSLLEKQTTVPASYP